MSGKGSNRRGTDPESLARYAAGWDAIFRKPKNTNSARVKQKRLAAVQALRRLDEELAQPTRPGTRQVTGESHRNPGQVAEKRREPYPSWVCADCATKAGGKHRRADGISTWHTGDCEVCGITQWVTQPRDYGYPRFQK